MLFKIVTHIIQKIKNKAILKQYCMCCCVALSNVLYVINAYEDTYETDKKAGQLEGLCVNCCVSVNAVEYVVNFHGDQIFVGFLAMIIYDALYSLHGV